MDLVTQATDLLESLADDLEQQADELLDIELNGAILTITLEDECLTQGQFLLNFHGPTQQLWLSSPVTGAHHFAYDNGQWICTKSAAEFYDMLERELQQTAGQNIDIKPVDRE